MDITALEGPSDSLTNHEVEVIMKNSISIQNMAEDLDTQKTFFALNGEGARFNDRFTTTGIPQQIRIISSKLGDDTQADDAERLLSSISALLDPGLIRELVLEESRRFNASSIYTIAAQFFESDGFHGIVLHTDPFVQISILALPPMSRALKDLNKVASTDRGITVQGNDILVTFVYAGDATLALWAAEPFDRATALGIRVATPLPRRMPSDGESVFLEGGRHGLSIKQSTGPILMAMISRRKARSPVSTHYREDDGTLFSCSSASVMSSRAQLLATTVRELNFHAGLPTLLDLLDHPDHFVRWHAMREALTLDLTAARPHLTRLASSDIHPQVREVARQSLQIIAEIE